MLGGFIPLASYTIAHQEAPHKPVLWVLVACGLASSALTVFDWARVAFRPPMVGARVVGPRAEPRGAREETEEDLQGMRGLFVRCGYEADHFFARHRTRSEGGRVPVPVPLRLWSVPQGNAQPTIPATRDLAGGCQARERLADALVAHADSGAE